MWKLLILSLFITTSLDALPLDQDTESNNEVPVPPTELLPPLIDAEESKFDVDIFNESVTLATELLPPFETNKTEKLGIVYIINLYAVKNASENNDEEILNADITGKIPGILEPIATVLLVLEEDDENKPVSLDEFAKDLEDDGFKVERIGDDGELQVIKIDMDGTEEPDYELIKPGKLNKIRKRRSPEPHLGLLSKLLDKKRGDDCDPCRQKQYYQQQQPPQYYQPPPPQYYQPPPQHYQPPPQHYQPPPQHYQPPRQHYQPPPQQQIQQPCNVCGQTGGNHGSHSQSFAQASAQSSSSSW